MLRKIEQIRKKPKEVRNRYAFWFATVFTAVITVFWVSSLPARMQVLTGAVPTSTEKTEGGFFRMWQNMKASVIDRSPEASTDVIPQDKISQVTLDEFMASTSEQTEEDPVGRPILIGTTTQNQGTSTIR